VNLHPAPPATPAIAPEPEGEKPERAEAEPRETIAGDLGRLLDAPERLIDFPVGPPDRITARICKSSGLDPHRLAGRDGAWSVKAHPADLATDPAARDAPMAAPSGDRRPGFADAAFEEFSRRPAGGVDPATFERCQSLNVDPRRLIFREGEWMVWTDPDKPDARPFIPLRLWPKMAPDAVEPFFVPPPEPGPPKRGPP
jgi:hypothetical protein